MKKILFVLGISAFITASCKHKKAGQEESNGFFPVLSFLQGQVKDIDTSVYPLLKIVTIDSTSDSSFIKRTEFRQYANDFLSIPDISSEKLKDDYTESKLYDETLGRAVIDYSPKSPDAEIRREEVMIVPDEQTGGRVTSIFINRRINTSDSTIEKKMYWQVNKRFQIVTIIQKRDQPDQIKTVQIVWNDFSANQ